MSELRRDRELPERYSSQRWRRAQRQESCDSAIDKRNYLSRDWSHLPFQLIRTLLPGTLLYAIWRGQHWARFAMAALFALLLYVNLSSLSDFSSMLRPGHWDNALQLVLMLAAYAVMTCLSLFSPALPGLMYFRRDECDLGEARR